MTRPLMCWVLLLSMTVVVAPGCRNTEPAPMKEVQRVRAGGLDVVVLSPTGTLQQGRATFALEFRGADGQLIDAGTVSVNATMPMAGMAPMFGESTVASSTTTGRYEVSSDLNMAGNWRLGIEWNGPAGRGSTSIAGTVR